MSQVCLSVDEVFANFSLPPISNPGMISGEEERLYYYLARECYRPGSLYLEIGTWLGRSTVRICEGLSSRGDDWRLICYDKFEWLDFYAKRAADQGANGRWIEPVAKLRPGESFEQAFLQYLSAYRDHISTRRGSLGDIGAVMHHDLQPGTAIRGLFVDASKGWPENASLLRVVGPHLAPGETSILFQDFLYCQSYKLMFLLLGCDFLEPYLFTKSGTSVVMKLKAEIHGSEPILQDGSIKTFTVDQIYRAWERAKTYFPEWKLVDNATNLALPLMLIERGFHAEATEELGKVHLTGEMRAFANAKLTGKVVNFKPLRAILGARA